MSRCRDGVVMTVLPASDYKLMQPSDYEWATLHIAWHRDDKERYLLFAFLELIPAEIPKPMATKQVERKVSTYGKRCYVYFKREVLPIKDALAWYASCRDGHVDLVNNPKPTQLIINAFMQEPLWPVLTSTNALPFVAYTARTHHLLQSKRPKVVERLRDDIETV